MKFIFENGLRKFNIILTGFCLVLSSVFLISEDTKSNEEPSVVKIPKNPRRHFSPNTDGIKDTFKVYLDIEDNGAIDKWIVKIYSAKDQGSDIRTFESQNVKEIYHMTPKKFLNRIFAKKKPVVIPEYIEWDGMARMSEAGQAWAEAMKDGIYYFRIFVRDEAGNEYKSPFVSFVLDTVTPQIMIKLDDLIFSPNGDGRKEDAYYTLTGTQLSKLDTITFMIASGDKTNNVVLKEKFSGKVLGKPMRYKWDGRLKNGKKAPEGNYKIFAYAEDLAGNFSKSDVYKTKLVRKIENAVLTVSAEIFSPDQNGFYDSIAFQLSTDSLEDFLDWHLSIKDIDGKEVASFAGQDRLTPYINYSGLGNDKTVLADGVYQAVLTLNYDSGNRPVSEPVRFEIDNTPPEVSVSLTYNSFVPVEGADGRQTMKIRQSCKGRKGDVFEGVVLDEMGTVVFSKTYTDKCPEIFEWDGKNKDGQIVPGNYTYRLTGRDRVANESRDVTASFELVTEKADASVIASDIVFSPGSSKGVKDEVRFKITANRQDSVTVQALRIETVKNQKVREFRLDHFAADVTWDGLDDNGDAVADGRYHYTLKLEYDTDESVEIFGRYVFVDNTPVKLSLKALSDVFSPNGDGRKEVIEFKQSKEPGGILEDKDKITITIRDIKDVIYRNHEWTEDIPGSVKWSGKGQNNREAPEGMYVYELNAVDAAGNTSRVQTKPFELVRKMESVSFTVSDNVFSGYPENDNHQKIEVIPAFSTTNYFTDYTVHLISKAGDVFDLKTVSDPLLSFSWEGKSDSNIMVESGLYDMYLSASYRNGNRPSSALKPVTVDHLPPQIGIHISPKFFSPDGNGVDDILNIGLKINDNIEMDESEVIIFRYVQFDHKMNPFKQTFNNYNKNLPVFKRWDLNGGYDDVIKWDGLSDDGELVESANDYILFVKSVDRAGNMIIEKKKFTVDVLVIDISPTRKKIIINSIYFELGSAELTGDYEKTLNRLVHILNKFPEYQIEVRGHTDERGRENYNKELSLKRAQSVYKYIRRHDIPRDRLTVTGKGESELLITGAETEEEHRRNRRVEFYLVKEKGEN